MSTYNTKNYTAHGGAETVIGGKLTFLPGAQVEGLVEILGEAPSGFPQIANQKPSEATTVAVLREDFNRLLTALMETGIMAAVEKTVLVETETEPEAVAE